MPDVIEKMSRRVADWLIQEGKDADVVISSRVRLARNLQDFPFVDRASEDQQKAILSEVLSVVAYSELMKQVHYFDISSVEELDREFLVERRLISTDFAERENARGLLVTADEKTGVMINEEDHLRIQVICSGFSLGEAWDAIRGWDEAFSNHLNYASSERFGYLTACPTNVGTGVRFSVFVHLPVLIFTKEVEALFAEIVPAGIAVRGFYGEGSKVIGNFFQISNQYTLGWTEQGILDRITPLIERLIDQEREARKRVMNDQRIVVEDKVCRALGVLSRAKLLSFMEFLDLLSALRLGSYLGIFPEIEGKVLNELMVITQPAHIQKLEGKVLNASERDAVRASLVREKLYLN